MADPPDPPARGAQAGSSPSKEPETIARNAGVVLFTQVASAVMTAVLTVYLARKLGPADFGVFALALGIEGILLLPADFGISQSAARFIAERRGDPAAVGGVLRTATRLKIVLSGTVAVALILAAGPIAGAYDEPDLKWAIRGIALSTFGAGFMALYGGAFSAAARSSKTIVPALSESTMELATSVALVASGAGAVGAAFGRAAGYLVGALTSMGLAGRHLALFAKGVRKNVVSPRRMATYGGALLIIDGAYSMFDQIDVILIGAILSASAAGIFQAPLRLLRFLSYPGNALATAVSPRVAKHDVHEPNVAAFQTGLRYMLAFQMMVTVVILVWADPIIRIVLGPDYAESADVLRALGPYVLLSGIGPLVTLSVNYLGAAAKRVPIALGALALNVAIDLVLIPKIGVVGGAVGTDVAYSLYVPAHLYLCKRLLDLKLAPLALTFVRVLVAGAAMAGVLALIGTSAEVGIPSLLAGGLAGLVTYVGALVLTRELSLGDLTDLRATLGRARP